MPSPIYHLSIPLPTYLYIYLSIYSRNTLPSRRCGTAGIDIFTYLSTHLPIYPPTHLSIFLSISIYLSSIAERTPPSHRCGTAGIATTVAALGFPRAHAPSGILPTAAPTFAPPPASAAAAPAAKRQRVAPRKPSEPADSAGGGGGGPWDEAVPTRLSDQFPVRVCSCAILYINRL